MDETSIVRGLTCAIDGGVLTSTEFSAPDRQTGNPDQTFNDAMLVGHAGRGMLPCVQAARMTFAAAPEALQGAVATGINGAGSVILGAAENAGELLVRGVTKMEENGECAAEAAERIAGKLRAARKPVPGLGYPFIAGRSAGHAPAGVGA